MIVGVTGTFRSGKDTVANYLVSKGFMHYSLSDYIRKVAKERGFDEKDRTTLQNIANELRTSHGPGFLSEKALEYCTPGMRHVVSSIRNPSEVEILRKGSAFVLISVDAPIKDRYERALLSGDKRYQTFGEFVKSEEREKSNDPNGQQLHICISLADYTIFNTGVGAGSVTLLEQKIEQVLRELEKGSKK